MTRRILGIRSRFSLLAIMGCITVEAPVPAPAMTGAATRATSPAAEASIVLPGVSPVCNVAIWVRSTGVIQIAQVVKSSGSSNVDEQCAWDGINGTMEPAKLYGVAIDKLLMIPMKWMESPSAILAPEHDVSDTPIPQLADQEFHLDPPYYPELALKLGRTGICAMHILVSAAGDIDQIQLTRSTGSEDLDTACLDTMYAAEFIPAQRDGQTFAAATNVYLAWRLPK
jgi:TonB family protein